MDVKIALYKNKMVVTGEGASKTVTPTQPFTTRRLLVGAFKPAAECLKQGLDAVGARGWLKTKPRLTIVAMEMVDGGLSDVEERCLTELGYEAGARRVTVKTAQAG